MESPFPDPRPAETLKRMNLRYAGKCRMCGVDLEARTVAYYERPTKTVLCLTCHETEPRSESEARSEPVSVAGSSARREYERRKTNAEGGLRRRWGRLGGVAVALSSERQTTRAWKQGAVGEEQLGARLDALVSEDIAVLHDRRVPGTRANIDHLVITASGVWVVDAKNYKGRPQLKVNHGGDGLRGRLLVGRRDCTSLVTGVLWQRQVVQSSLPEVPVDVALCFIGADWPLLGGSFNTQGVHVVWPRRLAKLLTAEMPRMIDVATTRDALVESFRPA